MSAAFPQLAKPPEPAMPHKQLSEIQPRAQIQGQIGCQSFNPRLVQIFQHFFQRRTQRMARSDKNWLATAVLPQPRRALRRGAEMLKTVIQY